MTNEEYINNAVRTEAKDYGQAGERAAWGIRGLHAAIGCATESGELLDAFKKSVFYGRPLDRTNVIEEVGDLMWYIALMADELEFTFEECMDANVRKLRSRYPEKFEQDLSLNRDLVAERSVLEG